MDQDRLNKINDEIIFGYHDVITLLYAGKEKEATLKMKSLTDLFFEKVKILL